MNKRIGGGARGGVVPRAQRKQNASLITGVPSEDSFHVEEIENGGGNCEENEPSDTSPNVASSNPVKSLHRLHLKRKRWGYLLQKCGKNLFKVMARVKVVFRRSTTMIAILLVNFEARDVWKFLKKKKVSKKVHSFSLILKNVQGQVHERSSSISSVQKRI